MFQDFDFSLEAATSFVCTLDNRECRISLDTASSACSERPMAETIINVDFHKRGTISELGKGWVAETVLNWFTNKPITPQLTKQLEKKAMTTKNKNNGPKAKISSGRNISSKAKAEECNIILKTLESIHLDNDNECGKGYTMKCNVDNIGK